MTNSVLLKGRNFRFIPSNSPLSGKEIRYSDISKLNEVFPPKDGEDYYSLGSLYKLLFRGTVNVISGVIVLDNEDCATNAKMKIVWSGVISSYSQIQIQQVGTPELWTKYLIYD